MTEYGRSKGGIDTRREKIPSVCPYPAPGKKAAELEWILVLNEAMLGFMNTAAVRQIDVQRYSKCAVLVRERN